MSTVALSIGELADAAGLSRRAVRFYVQQKLLPPPLGVGRGNHYDASHLARLHKISELQAAGHSLEAIRKIISGAAPAAAQTDVRADSSVSLRAPAGPKLSASLWTHLNLAPGVEIQFDANRYQPDAAQLLAIRAAVRQILLKEYSSAGGDQPDQRNE